MRDTTYSAIETRLIAAANAGDDDAAYYQQVLNWEVRRELTRTHSDDELLAMDADDLCDAIATADNAL